MTDRRKFTPEGEPRFQEDESAEEAPAQTKTAPPPDVLDRERGATRKTDTAAERKDRQHPPEAPLKVGFTDLVNMLASNALVQLGEVPDPLSGKPAENLSGAQVMIAFLEALQKKTKGNLSQDEERILDNVLYDLRMWFVAKSNVRKS